MQSDTTSVHGAPTTSHGSSRPASAAAKRPKKRGGAKKKRARAATGQAKIAKGRTYALVARLGPEVYRKAWAKVRSLVKSRKPGQDRVSMSSWLATVIARAAK